MYTRKQLLLGAVTLAATTWGGTAALAAMPAGLSAEVEAGLGYDSNIYLAPGSSYIDYAQTGNPPITPETQAGIFVPLNLKLAYLGAQSGLVRGEAGFDFKSRFYFGSEADNGNECSSKLRGGARFVLAEKGSRQDYIYVGPYVGRHKEVYVDRDTGIEKTTTTTLTDISDRYEYTNYGIEAEYERNIGRIDYGFMARWESRDYEDPVVVSQLDHDYYAIGGKVDLPLRRHMKLKLDYKYWVRDYDERPSRELDGTLPVGNPPREYTYHGLGASLRNRLSDSLVLYVDYDLTLRKDEYVGYDDYTKNKYGLRLLYEASPRLDLKLKAAYWERDYDNAYAFDNAALGIAKEYDGVEFLLTGEYELAAKWRAGCELRYEDDNSTDIRYDYERTQLTVTLQRSF